MASLNSDRVKTIECDHDDKTINFESREIF